MKKHFVFDFVSTVTFISSIVIMMIGLSGCLSLTGSNYVKPKIDIKSQWNPPNDPLILTDTGNIVKWWTTFNDPVLTRLIQKVANSNFDVQIAAARVNEARANLKIASSRRLPGVNLPAGVTYSRSSESMGIPSSNNPVTAYSLGVDASWEIDLFGRISKTIESAKANFQATQEDRMDMMVTMCAEVASAYINVRTNQAGLEAANSNIKSQKDSLELTKIRFKNGLANDLDVEQAQRVLANSEAQVPVLRIQLIRAINTIGVLLGQSPRTFAQELSLSKPIPTTDTKMTIGVPADLLRRRADIRAAERRLAAQTAQIGVAKADLFPTLALNGSFGLQATDTNNFFDTDSRTYSFGVPLSWTLFDGGRIRAQIKVEDAKTKQALLNYEKTVLNACKEVENAIASFREERTRLEALQRAVNASRRTVMLSTKLYKGGLSDYQNVLDAQRSLFDAENQMFISHGNSVIYMVQLYKALGGGWNVNQCDEKKGE